MYRMYSEYTQTVQCTVKILIVFLQEILRKERLQCVFVARMHIAD